MPRLIRSSTEARKTSNTTHTRRKYAQKQAKSTRKHTLVSTSQSASKPSKDGFRQLTLKWQEALSKPLPTAKKMKQESQEENQESPKENLLTEEEEVGTLTRSRASLDLNGLISATLTSTSTQSMKEDAEKYSSDTESSVLTPSSESLSSLDLPEPESPVLFEQLSPTERISVWQAENGGMDTTTNLSSGLTIFTLPLSPEAPYSS